VAGFVLEAGIPPVARPFVDISAPRVASSASFIIIDSLLGRAAKKSGSPGRGGNNFMRANRDRGRSLD